MINLNIFNLKPSIIIEGADQQGKSTLAKKIIEINQYKYFHLKKPKVGKVFNDYSFLNNISHFILDRGPLSDIIYNNLFRKIIYSKEELKNINNFFQKKNCIILLCRRNNFLQKDILDREELYNSNDIIKAYNEFNKNISLINLPLIKLDPWEDLFFIEKIINKYRK